MCTAITSSLLTNNSHILDLATVRDIFESGDPHNGLTPLHFASMNADSLATEILLACHVDPNSTDNNGNTALHYVSKRGYETNCKVGLRLSLCNENNR